MSTVSSQGVWAVPRMGGTARLHPAADVVAGEEGHVLMLVGQTLQGVETAGARRVPLVGRDQEVRAVDCHRVLHPLGRVPLQEIGTGGDSGSPHPPFPLLESGIAFEEGRPESNVGHVPAAGFVPEHHLVGVVVHVDGIDFGTGIVGPTDPVGGIGGPDATLDGLGVKSRLPPA